MAIKQHSLNDVSQIVGSTQPDFEISESEFLAQYPEGSDSYTTLNNTLAGIDRRTTVAAAFDQSTSNEWRQLVPELFMTQVLNTKIKRQDYSVAVCPNSVTVSRDPATWLSLDQGADIDTKPSWQLLAEQEDVAKTMQSYKKKSVELKRYGQGHSVSRETLLDVPLDVLAHRQILYQATLIPFKENMLTASLYTATSGAFATAYSNVHVCQGVRTSIVNAAGSTVTRNHGISVDDVLQALQVFRTEQSPTSEIIGTSAKGQNYYSPSVIVLSPAAITDLCMELWRGGHSNIGPNFGPRNQVMQTAQLSELFGVPVVPLWSVKWTDDTPETPNNWEYVSDGFIVDSDLGPVELVHSDGWFVQSWFVDSKRTWCYAQSRRSNYFVQDCKAVLRLESAV